MLCHGIEASRFILTAPHEEKEELTLRAVSAEIAALKWSRQEYAEKLREMTEGQIDYLRRPAEEWKSSIIWEAGDGILAI